MKIPMTPPDWTTGFSSLVGKGAIALPMLSAQGPEDEKGRYVHWDKLRFLHQPDGMTKEEWWAAMKLARLKLMVPLSFTANNGAPVNYCSPPSVQECLHWVDVHAAGSIKADKQITNSSTKSTYLIKSLVEEAISSSQLEGASTTRHVAKEMIRQGRAPKDISERMIYNNYQAMQFIREIKSESLTKDIVFEIHKILTRGTLDDPAHSGAFRKQSDSVKVVDAFNEVLHVPPPALELEMRMQNLCDFANGEGSDSKTFIHPVVRAILLHFMLAYDHPFVDGNGRTARALFYWSMARQGYWLVEYISISRIIKSAPVKYGRAFLYTETDDLDATYFIVHQLGVIKRAIVELQDYLHGKMQGIEYAEYMLHKNSKLRGELNFRQLALLKHALKHPRFIYRINEHQQSHGIAYETARKDLMHMADDLGLLHKVKDGKIFMFISPTDLEERLSRKK